MYNGFGFAQDYASTLAGSGKKISEIKKPSAMTTA